MSDPWDAEAAAWDDDLAARAYATAAVRSLRAAVDERGISLGGAVVCDFGCGTGLLTEQLVDEAESIDAIDTSTAMLDVLGAKIAAHGWTNVRQRSDVPTSRGEHDLVVCSSVCSFVDDYPGTAQRLSELLRPGGVFVQWDWERDGDDEHGLTREEIRQAMESAGLVALHIDTAFEVEAEGHIMKPLIGIGQRGSGEHVARDVMPEAGRQRE